MPIDVGAAALGEAMAASLTQTAILIRLVLKGILEKQEALELIDNALLILERHRQQPEGLGTEAIDHARARLEALLRQIEATPA